MKIVYLLAFISLCVLAYIVYSAGDKYYIKENHFVIKELTADNMFKDNAFGEEVAPRVIPTDRDGTGFEAYLDFEVVGFVYSDVENSLNEEGEIITKQHLVRITGEGIQVKHGWITTMFGKKNEGIDPVIEINGKRYFTLETELKKGLLIKKRL